LRSAVAPFYDEHERIRLDPTARNIQHTYLIKDDLPGSLRIQQILVDPEELNDWIAEFVVNMDVSRTTSEVSLTLKRIGSLV
jgi:hypothetical protein